MFDLKNLLIITFFIYASQSFSQKDKWVKSGDYLTFTTIGNFSNSATKNSKLGVKVIDEGGAIRIYLYEYGFQSPEAKLSYDSGESYIDVIKEGKVIEYDVWHTPSSMYFEKGTEFYKLLKEGGDNEINVVVGSWRFYEHNSAQYRFKLKSQ